MNYYISLNGKQEGPFSEEEIKQKLIAGRFALSDLAWTEGTAEWKTLSTLFNIPILAPTPDRSQPSQTILISKHRFPWKTFIAGSAAFVALFIWIGLSMEQADRQAVAPIPAPRVPPTSPPQSEGASPTVTYTDEQKIHALLQHIADTTSPKTAGLDHGTANWGTAPKPGDSAENQSTSSREADQGERPVAAASPDNDPMNMVADAQKRFNTPEVCQYFFDCIHPVGHATSLKIHAVDWVDNDGNVLPPDPTRLRIALKSGVALRVRLTLYWQGPLNANGFTKLLWTYDPESQRTTECKILATNGVTNADVNDTIVDALTALMTNSAQKN